MEPVVNIYADGRLAYTGFLSLAAIRQRLTYSPREAEDAEFGQTDF